MAVSTSGSVSVKVPVQVPPEEVHALTPAGLEETEPPLVAITVMVCVGMKRAVTFLAAFMLREQVRPVQSPEKPTKPEPLAGVGVSVTMVPERKFAAQVVPQAIPAGEEAIDPVPVPDFVTVSRKEGVPQTLTVPVPPQV